MRVAARSIIRLRITPMWLLSTLLNNSPTTSSNGMLMNSTRCELPYFFQRKCATSITPNSWARPPRLKKQKWVIRPRRIIW
ncbi:hypothetical protein D9M71_679030 [compost metagenome]